MVPYFKSGEYGKGLYQGTQAIAAALAKNAGVTLSAVGEIIAPQTQSGVPASDITIYIILILFFIFFTYIPIIARYGKGYYNYGSWGGGFGGGGFGGGGGGGFGGGGGGGGGAGGGF